MTNLTLANRIWPQASSSALRNIVLAVAGSLVVAVAAQVSVPMQPVPLTLQTLAVLAIGAAYGARLGAATLALYVLEGAVGLPVFAEMKSGLATIMGPTGGYLLGFILAATLVGWLAERGFDRSVPKMLIAMLAGAAVLYVPGLIWLNGFVGSVEKTLALGFLPFLLGDLIKAAVAALGFPAVWSLINRKV